MNDIISQMSLNKLLLVDIISISNLYIYVCGGKERKENRCFSDCIIPLDICKI